MPLQTLPPSVILRHLLAYLLYPPLIWRILWMDKWDCIKVYFASPNLFFSQGAIFVAFDVVSLNFTINYSILYFDRYSNMKDFSFPLTTLSFSSVIFSRNLFCIEYTCAWHSHAHVHFCARARTFLYINVLCTWPYPHAQVVPVGIAMRTRISKDPQCKYSWP